MKIIVTVVFSILCFSLQAPVVWAADWRGDQAKADQYYEAGKYSKAYKIYYKLAKMGVSHSQDRVSQIYENGQGKKANLEEAYAWSALAAQRGSAEKENRRDALLQQIQDEKAAEKRAEKLMSKYGRAALQAKADSRAKLKRNTRSGGCTGSKLGCR